MVKLQLIAVRARRQNVPDPVPWEKKLGASESIYEQSGCDYWFID